jgi:DNA topoisomerase IB
MAKPKFKVNDYEYINPETMKWSSFKSLPKAYQERIETNKKAQDYIESIDEEENPPKPVYKNKEQKERMETPDGHELAVYIRPAEQGGCVDKKGKLIIEKDERYDPKKSWKYPYGKQLVEIRKKTSHALGDNQWKSLYTKEYEIVHGAVRFEALRKVADTIDESKRRWTNDILGKNVDDSLCAIMCAMSYESPFRSGNTQSANRKKNKTFGITTLKAKHIKFIDGKDGETWVKVSFKGKGSEPIKKIIKNKIVVAKLRSLLKNKEPEDYLFTNKEGKLVDASTLNHYCRKLGIPKYHMFRHLRASQIFKEASDKLINDGYVPDMPTTKEILKMIKICAEESAKALGNTSAVCIQKYIAPQLMFDLFKRYDLPVADVIKNLAKLPSNATKKDLKDMEYDDYWSKIAKENDEEEIDEIEETEASVDDTIDILGDRIEQYETFANFDNIPETLVDVNNTTYKEDEEARKNFETYILTYEHDDNDIINNPDNMVLSTVLVPVDWTPDYSLMEEFVHRRPDQYRVEKDTNYDPKSSSDVTQWGFNDFVGMTPQEVNERMMDDAKRDIDRLTKEMNNDSSV